MAIGLAIRGALAGFRAWLERQAQRDGMSPPTIVDRLEIYSIDPVSGRTTLDSSSERTLLVSELESEWVQDARRYRGKRSAPAK